MNRYPDSFRRGYDEEMRYRREGRFYDFRRDRGDGGRGRYDASFGGGYGMGRSRYQEDYDRGAWDRGYRNPYDQAYRFRPPPTSSWQTNHGDPFGDRQRRTPMRVERGSGRSGPPRFPRVPYGQDYENWGAKQPYWRVDPRAGYLLD